MIKTDYKPKSAKKPIFSSAKKRSSLPVVLMAVIALALVVYGISSELTTSDTQMADSEQMNQIPLNEKASEETSTSKPNSAIISGDIPLNLGSENSGSKPAPVILDDSSASNDKAKQPPTDNSQSDNQTDKLTQAIPTAEPNPLPKSEPEVKWSSTKVRSGDSMARIFNRLKFSPRTLHDIITSGEDTQALKKIMPGQMIEYQQSPEGDISALRYTMSPLKQLLVELKDGTWQSQIQTKPVEIRIKDAKGTIESSLFMAGKQAGLTDALVMELAGIFGWDIDFILDIRTGDSFTLIYEQKYVEGNKIGNGNILAAEFINQGKTYRAVRYEDSKGDAEYYTPEGLSMRKAFLRAPVDFSYISSKFNPKRFHPILRRVKAHNGVDYRAPKGTPVKAAGDGKVIASAYSKYNGHYVFIQHGQKYVTKYLHFTKRAVRRGQRVKQGQIIGYVGATGLAEAPHLHYEFLVNGVHRNPRTIKLPDAEPIASREKQRFKQNTYKWVQLLQARSQEDDQIVYAE